MTFTRYAIYYTPPKGSIWGQRASHWLGWDMEQGTHIPHPTISNLDISGITQTPRKYGLHATLKPPFRLADDMSLTELTEACETLANGLSPVTLNGLELARLGRFLALRTIGDETALAEFAATCVTTLDAFRAPASDTEIAKRRAGGLTATQDAHLLRWGYPYVLDQFKFHITLTGKRPKTELPAIETALRNHLVPYLPAPFEIYEIALVGEAEDGQFHMIHRYPLGG
ncbi:DUF1045 domain-containing protein [Epibacterium ulvae]|uniref:DUF1045 domain-containing protein n=1 Tax=Epibacterium ulvae TaxID=1156985 RepID=UPI00249385B2|nr:DUF1045 domain-containing protein [Epibacterium ulvae]